MSNNRVISYTKDDGNLLKEMKKIIRRLDKGKKKSMSTDSSYFKVTPYSVRKTEITTNQQIEIIEAWLVEGQDENAEWRRTYFVGASAELRANVYCDLMNKQANVLIDYP